MKPFWVCRCDDGWFEIWTIKPKWESGSFDHPTSGILMAKEYLGCMKRQVAQLIMPDAIKGLRVGCSRKLQL